MIAAPPEMPRAGRGWRPFACRVPGKWVLAGEHAVLAGATAIALPHPELSLSLCFEPVRPEPGSSFLAVDPASARETIEDMLASIAPEALAPSGGAAPVGRLSIQSTIPIGAGLGSSAALCVAVTRWLAEPLGLQPAAIPDFATRLEHRFHGRSSGMDVAVIAAGAPVSFAQGRGARPLGVARLPRFTFHDTGLRARTSECVARVAAFRERQPAAAARVDERMARAADEAMRGLAAYDGGAEGDGLERVARAMEQGQACFDDWGLMPAVARALRERLLAEGALSARITGAGGGGMIVALWSDRG